MYRTLCSLIHWGHYYYLYDILPTTPDHLQVPLEMLFAHSIISDKGTKICMASETEWGQGKRRCGALRRMELSPKQRLVLDRFERAPNELHSVVLAANHIMLKATKPQTFGRPIMKVWNVPPFFGYEQMCQ